MMPPGQSFSFFLQNSLDVILRSVPSDEADIFSAPRQDSHLFGGDVSGGRVRVTCITLSPHKSHGIFDALREFIGHPTRWSTLRCQL